MNQCAYHFKIGKKKGLQCPKQTKNTHCSSHTPEAMEKHREYDRQRRRDPQVRQKEREYIRKKRQDPEFRAKEDKYKEEYCQKHNLTREQLEKNIKEEVQKKVNSPTYNQMRP
jgi:Skp family chaperone for outer membrane proteins